MLSILRDNYTEPLNSHSGASVVNKKWSELLYHTNRYMQRGSLMENYAIRKLQEQIICQVFHDLFFKKKSNFNLRFTQKVCNFATPNSAN